MRHVSIQRRSAIGVATIPMHDEGRRSFAALDRVIEGAVRGVQRRESAR